jgi:hypothetical protein
LRVNGAAAQADIEELWRRMAFSILITPGGAPAGRALGMSARELDSFADAFENAELEAARKAAR